MTTGEIDEIRAVVEKDLEWRQREISFLNSILSQINGSSLDDAERRRSIYRKTLLLCLYSHFEGFFRFSFETYSLTLNEANIDVEKVIDVLCVSSLNEIFLSYDESNKWILPKEDGFNSINNRIYNRSILLQEIHASKKKILKLPVSEHFSNRSSVVNTESNLNAKAIDKILYGLGIHKSLGLNEIDFMKLMGVTSEFVKKRNGIAHGDNKSEYKDGISIQELKKYQDLFNRVVALIPAIITKSLEQKLYLKEEYR